MACLFCDSDVSYAWVICLLMCSLQTPKFLELHVTAVLSLLGHLQWRGVTKYNLVQFGEGWTGLIGD